MKSCSAVILAGGLNSRMGGKNKAFLEVGGCLILDRIIDTLKQIFSDILLVTKEPDLYKGLHIKIIQDIFDVRSSLTGIHAGLVNIKSDYAFFVACDTPFLKKDVILELLNKIEPQTDIIIPVDGRYFEPLFAVYSRRCIPFIEHQLNKGNLKITKFFEKVLVKTINKNHLKKVDPDLISFFNINTPMDLKKIQNYSSALDFIKDLEPLD